MQKRTFFVTNNIGEKLACVEVLPTQTPGKPLPVAVLCHGFAYFKEEDGIFTSLAERLAAQGYVVYYFDFSGCGESDGDYPKTSLTKLVNDLKSVLHEVKNYDYINQKRLSLVGQSFGTNVCIAAQELGIERLVLCGAFGDPYKLLSSLFTAFDATKPVSRLRSDGRTTTINPPFWQDLQRYKVPELIANFTCPILFVHGEKDDIVPIEEGRKLMSHAQNATMVVIEKSNHGLQPGREQVINEIAAFFPSAHN